jgi:hypothetical protein
VNGVRAYQQNEEEFTYSEGGNGVDIMEKFWITEIIENRRGCKPSGRKKC